MVVCLESETERVHQLVASSTLRCAMLLQPFSHRLEFVGGWELLDDVDGYVGDGLAQQRFSDKFASTNWIGLIVTRVCDQPGRVGEKARSNRWVLSCGCAGGTELFGVETCLTESGKSGTKTVDVNKRRSESPPRLTR